MLIYNGNDFKGTENKLYVLVLCSLCLFLRDSQCNTSLYRNIKHVHCATGYSGFARRGFFLKGGQIGHTGDITLHVNSPVLLVYFLCLIE